MYLSCFRIPKQKNLFKQGNDFEWVTRVFLGRATLDLLKCPTIVNQFSRYNYS